MDPGVLLTYLNKISLLTMNMTPGVLILNYRQQIKDFRNCPTMLKEVLMFTVAWFVVAILFYSF